MSDDQAHQDAASKHGIAYRRDGAVAWLTMDDPERRNVLTPDAIETLRSRLVEASSDASVRVIVLTGSGSTFCAGADLRAAASARGGYASGPGQIAELLQVMLACPKPLVARVQGHVAGGGNGLVAACDIAIAANSAKFAFSEVRVGVAPAVISVVCLRRLTTTAAHRYFLTGERFTAAQAVASGLVNEAVDDDALDRCVGELVDDLLRAGPEAARHTKDLLRHVPAMSIDDGLSWTTSMSTELFETAEAKEGMDAFLGRRPASWAVKNR